MCYLQLSKHYSMRHYSQNVQICIIPDILLLLLQWTHRVSITFLHKTMRMGIMGGAPFAPAPPGRLMPPQAPLPGPSPKNQGKGQNPNPPVPPKLTPPGLTPSELESDDFYVPKTPSLRSPLRDLDSSHGFFNPNPGPHDQLYDETLVTYGNPDGSPSNI